MKNDVDEFIAGLDGIYESLCISGMTPHRIKHIATLNGPDKILVVTYDTGTSARFELKDSGTESARFVLQAA